MFIPASVTQIDGNVFRDCKKALILGEPGSEAAYFAKHSNISFQERDMASNGLEELGKGLWLYRKDGQQTGIIAAFLKLGIQYIT